MADCGPKALTVQLGHRPLPIWRTPRRGEHFSLDRPDVQRFQQHRQPETSVAGSGDCRLSRSPMRLAFLLVPAGRAAYRYHGSPWRFLPANVGSMNRFQIAPEERMLATRFGAGYEQYRQRVRRRLQPADPPRSTPWNHASA